MPTSNPSSDITPLFFHPSHLSSGINYPTFLKTEPEISRHFFGDKAITHNTTRQQKKKNVQVGIFRRDYTFVHGRISDMIYLCISKNILEHVYVCMCSGQNFPTSFMCGVSTPSSDIAYFHLYFYCDCIFLLFCDCRNA